MNSGLIELVNSRKVHVAFVKWEKVEDNMVAFCDAGGLAKWTFLVFRHNEHQVNLCYRIKLHMLSGYFMISFVPGVQSGVTVKSMSMYFLNWAIHKHSFPTGEDWTSGKKQKGREETIPRTTP